MLQLAVVGQKPSEKSLLDFLIIFFFEKLIAEKLHGPHNNKFSSSRAGIKSSNWSISWETNWTTGQQRHRWLSDVNCAPVWVNEFQTTVLVSVVKLIFGVSVLLGVFTWLVLLFFLPAFSLRSFDKFIIEAPVSDVCFFWMEVLVESFSNNAVIVDTNSYLFEHCVDVS